MMYAPDRKLFIYVTLLITASIIVVYSMSEFVVLLHKTTDLHFFFKELIFGSISIFLMWLVAQFNPDKHLPILGTVLFILATLAMIAMPFLPESLVHAVGGAKRWIKLVGFSIAPVEFLKLVLYGF